MSAKLSYKLFGALFMMLVLVVGTMGLSRYFLKKNLRDYIHQVEVERLESLVPLLQEEYRSHGGWDNIKGDYRYWRRLVRKGLDIQNIELQRPAPDAPGAAPGFAPPGDYRKPPRLNKRPRHRTRYLLTDSHLQPIIGSPQRDDEKQLVAIQVDGQTVGWLGLKKGEPFKKGPPAAILKQQAMQNVMTGAVVIGITALIAFMLTRHLLTPVNRLADGTRELANRNFSIRIRPTTGDELGQLAVNFNSMAQTLENYENTRRQWLTDISHELRTPLSVLRGEIESLVDGVREPTQQNLASLHDEVLRIGKLVEDLHLLSVADSDNLYLSLQSISPLQVLENIIAAFEARFAQRQIEIDTQYGNEYREKLIKGDVHRIGQVFTNILENTIKYIQSPGKLTILVQVDKNVITFFFQDTGPGVPVESLTRIFDRLYREDISRSRNLGGSGLGLSICRQIVENHSGKIWAERNVEGGLTIGIQLPLEKANI